MAKLSTYKKTNTHRAIIFGAPKAGKTQLAGGLAKEFKLIWIDLENGHETLFKLPKDLQENIELINLKDTPTYPIGIETVLKMIKGKVSICESHGKVGCMLCKKYQKDEEKLAEEGTDLKDKFFFTVDLPNLSEEYVVVFDSLTQLTTSAINNITKGKDDEYKMKTDDWGSLAKLMEVFLSTIQQATYNLVVISHEVESETEGKKKVLVPVAGSKNTARNSAKAFDHVIYAERKNREHQFSSSTDYSNTILTGSRSDAKLEDQEVPSLVDLFKGRLSPVTKKDKAKATLGSLAAKYKSKVNKS